MSSIPGTVTVAGRRWRPLLRLSALLAALAVAGCGPVGLPSPAGSASPPASSSGSPVVGVDPAPTRERTAEPLPKPTERPGPPTVSLISGVGGVPVPGALGSYVWDGAGSDAPWLVPPGAEAVRARGPYAVTVAPSLAIERWRAAWAPVVGGEARDPIGRMSGAGGLVLVPGPGAAGAWSLQVDIRFAGGNHGAWYWRVEVLP
ncbi:MAG TPA: hypothetical protein VES19_08555 [Candidatus Limnocylindrales bacterium]|nr:hypothetical protein [Candidatus Limnocylindrales bacterium]